MIQRIDKALETTLTFVAGVFAGIVLVILVVNAFPIQSHSNVAAPFVCRETDRVESVIDDSRLVTVTITCREEE